MLLSLLAFFVTAILAASLSSTAAISPQGLQPAQTPNCSSWIIIPGRDLKNTADLKNHPVWNKKFISACACAAAIAVVKSPRAPLFVWNSQTTGCYPKGMTPYTTQPRLGVLQMSGVSYEYASQQPDLKGFLDGEVNVCHRFATPFPMNEHAALCGEFCQSSTYYGLCDFSIIAQLRGESTQFCSLCKFQAATGQVLGYRRVL